MSSKKNPLLRLVLAASFVLPLYAGGQVAAEAAGKGLTPAQIRFLARYGPIIQAKRLRNHKMTTG